VSEKYRAGYVTLLGRPNVGKSTLLNRLVKQKISITANRPQTTRHSITGINTTDSFQIIYVDTPGFNNVTNSSLNKRMNKTSRTSLVGVDCIVLMIGPKGWTEADKAAAELLHSIDVPVFLVINKIDILKDKNTLLPFIENSAAETGIKFEEIIPISAETGENVNNLEAKLLAILPVQQKLFSDNQVTDKSDRFLAGELVREQIFRVIGEEVPYAVAVKVEKFKKEGKLLRIEAIIWVEKKGQKAILIGKKGDQIKKIGTHARKAMENSFGTKVFLELWVKVRANWRDNEQALRLFGYGDD